MAVARTGPSRTGRGAVDEQPEALGERGGDLATLLRCGRADGFGMAGRRQSPVQVGGQVADTGAAVGEPAGQLAAGEPCRQRARGLGHELSVRPQSMRSLSGAEER